MSIESLGFLGYGNMAGAIAEGLLKQGAIAAKHIFIFDPSDSQRQHATQMGLNVVEAAAELGEQCTTIVLAVKPQQMESALKDLHDGLGAEHVLISIAAGISIAAIEAQVPEGVRVIRVMPNTPALVRAGAAGIACSATCSDTDTVLAQIIFGAVGIAESVTESDMDAVTALSGSGPAYFFYMVECLVEAAVAQGLDRDVATRLASQTLLGAGTLLAQSDVGPATLREQVTSPGGTTAAALNTFRELNLMDTVAAAVKAAADRSKELGA